MDNEKNNSDKVKLIVCAALLLLLFTGVVEVVIVNKIGPFSGRSPTREWEFHRDVRKLVITNLEGPFDGYPFKLSIYECAVKITPRLVLCRFCPPNGSPPASLSDWHLIDLDEELEKTDSPK
jgi:hypothetical protein